MNSYFIRMNFLYKIKVPAFELISRDQLLPTTETMYWSPSRVQSSQSPSRTRLGSVNTRGCPMIFPPKGSSTSSATSGANRNGKSASHSLSTISKASYGMVFRPCRFCLVCICTLWRHEVLFGLKTPMTKCAHPRWMVYIEKGEKSRFSLKPSC